LAAIAAIDWAFANLGWTEVIHSIDPDNRPSILLAERLGSRNRGRGRLPEPFEHVAIDIYAQSRERTEGTRQREHADEARREDQRSPDQDPDSPHADVDRDDTSS
jgi:RimJ/RimL family protein N-acetyltransferase